MKGEPPIRRYSRLATPLHKAVEDAVRPVFKKRGIAESRLITEWPRIAGEVLAGKTLPKRVAFAKGQRDNGTLHLTVSPGWALEVQHLEPLILDKIATYFGYRAVAKLHITQAPLPLPQEQRRKRSSPPLSESQCRALEETISHVEDAELKAALESLGASILRDKPSRRV